MTKPRGAKRPNAPKELVKELISLAVNKKLRPEKCAGYIEASVLCAIGLTLIKKKYTRTSKHFCEINPTTFGLTTEGSLIEPETAMFVLKEAIKFCEVLPFPKTKDVYRYITMFEAAATLQDKPMKDYEPYEPDEDDEEEDDD